MEVIKLISAVHGLAGAMSLGVAPLAMIVRKGSKWHRFWGRAFFYGMIVVCATAVIMAIAHPENFWLALVAVFSFHMIASGYRSLYLKKLHEGLKPAPVDMWLNGIAAVVNGGLLIWGLAHILMGKKDLGAILYTVFGLIGMGMVVLNLSKFYRQRHDKHAWFFGHMTGFLGGYIATLSAFSAVNLNMIKPMWLQWLWPTIVGTPIIIIWTSYYRRQFTKGKRARQLADIRIR